MGDRAVLVVSQVESFLRRIADALEELVKLSKPERVSPMVKKQPPMWPYPDAPVAPPWYPTTVTY